MIVSNSLVLFLTVSDFPTDAASALIAAGDPGRGVRVLTSLAELELENAQFLRYPIKIRILRKMFNCLSLSLSLFRLIAFKLQELGDGYSLLTVQILRRVLQMRPVCPF